MVYFYYINKSYIYNQKIDQIAPVLYKWINTYLIQIYDIDFGSAEYNGVSSKMGLSRISRLQMFSHLYTFNSMLWGFFCN